MTRSVEEIERDVEATRSDLDRTVEALKEKMTPSNIASEVVGSVRNSPAGQRALRLGHQAKDNSIPLALMGAGLAWLLVNRSRSSHYETRTYDFEPDYDLGPEYQSQDASRTGAVRERVRGVADSARARMDSGASRARQAVSSARDTLSSTASSAAERTRMAADATRRRAVDYGHRAEETFMETLEREPLIIGALGVAVGAAVAATLPSTPIEDRYVGPLRDRALDEGKSRARSGLEQAKQVASAAARSVKDEAHREGMTDVNALVDKAERVVRSGVDTVKREVEARRSH